MRSDTEDTRVSQISMSFLAPRGGVGVVVVVVEVRVVVGMECEHEPVRS